MTASAMVAQLFFDAQAEEAATLASAAMRQAASAARKRAQDDQAANEFFARTAPVRSAPAPSLRGSTITGTAAKTPRLEDMELKGKAPGAAPSLGAGAAPGPSQAAPASAADGGPPSSAVAKLASGHRPVVLKVVSYAHGAVRASATAQYIQRDEAALETHDSRMLVGSEAVAAEMKDWARGFDRRRESDDVANVSLSIAGLADGPLEREALSEVVAAAFEGHKYAYGLSTTPAGDLRAQVVLVLAGPGERLRPAIRPGDAGRFNAKSESAVLARIAEATSADPARISIHVGKSGHGVEAAVQRLERLALQGHAHTESGRPVATAGDAQAIGRSWRHDLNSFTPRDTMHLVISAKADTDPAAFARSARAFLHDEFRDHKFAFAIHTDKAESAGHIHAHAIIAVKGENAERIATGPARFRAWRESYAEKAQAEGLAVVATSAMETASSQSYGARDKAIVEVAAHPRRGREERDRAYAAHNPHVIDNARKRIETARTNPVKLPATVYERAVANASFTAWRHVAEPDGQNSIIQNNVHRLAAAVGLGDIAARSASASQEPAMPVTAAKMREDLAAMNRSVEISAGQLTGATQEQFTATANRALQAMAVQTDLQTARERGVETMTREQVERLAGPDADRLIAKAQQIAEQDAARAAQTSLVASRAVEIERRDDGSAALNPTSPFRPESDQAFTRDALATAAADRQAANAAALAAQQLAARPGAPVDPNAVQTAGLEALKAEQAQVASEAQRAEDVEPEAERQKPFRMR